MQLYKKYFLSFMFIKLVEIIISLLKAAFLKSSVSISLEHPAYIQRTNFSYLPEKTVLSLVIKVPSNWCGSKVLNPSDPLLAKRPYQFRSCTKSSWLGTLVQLYHNWLSFDLENTLLFTNEGMCVNRLPSIWPNGP